HAPRRQPVHLERPFSPIALAEPGSPAARDRRWPIAHEPAARPRPVRPWSWRGLRAPGSCSATRRPAWLAFRLARGSHVPPLLLTHSLADALECVGFRLRSAVCATGRAPEP